MRKILRNIARANMRKAGIHRANKPRWTVDRNGIPAKRPSYFAEHWREYVN
jgi:hypothetical protein